MTSDPWRRQAGVLAVDVELIRILDTRCQQKGVAFTDVPGDHGAAFDGGDVIVAKVLAFLEA